jgi:hypothetical protein
MVALEGRFVLVAAARPPLFIKPPPDETWLGGSDAAQGLWHMLLLKSGASSRPVEGGWQEGLPTLSGSDMIGASRAAFRTHCEEGRTP